MRLTNKQNIMLLAKKYGKQIHGKDLQISADFMHQVNDLVQAVIMANVSNQDNLAGTLRSTSWGYDRLENAQESLEALDEV